jgi:hypothetical protein
MFGIIGLGVAFIATMVAWSAWNEFQSKIEASNLPLEKKTKIFYKTVISIAGIVALAGLWVTLFMPDTTSWKLSDIKDRGTYIGAEVSKELNGYTTFGIGKSGSITSINEGRDITFAPMVEAVGGRGYRSVDIYGTTHVSKSSYSGPGTMSIDEEVDEKTDKIVSGNYGTARAGKDLSWCFVIHKYGLYVKFTNLSIAYPHGTKPLACKNGR